MSIDYLGFEYRYNLIVENNSEGFEWKPMSVCMESKVLFDKHQVIKYFNLSEIYSRYENKINNSRAFKRNKGWDPSVENLRIYYYTIFFIHLLI